MTLEIGRYRASTSVSVKPITVVSIRSWSSPFGPFGMNQPRESFERKKRLVDDHATLIVEDVGAWF